MANMNNALNIGDRVTHHGSPAVVRTVTDRRAFLEVTRTWVDASYGTSPVHTVVVYEWVDRVSPYGVEVVR